MISPIDASEDARSRNDLRRRLFGLGALLMVLGLFTGLWTAAALTGKVTVEIPHLALAAHLNGLIGGLWLIAVASTMPSVELTLVGLKRMTLAIALSCYAAWLVTLVASFFGARGLEYTHDLANNIVAALLQVLVVLPALAGNIGWVWGLLRRRA
jgi:hypothetical protein